MILHLYFVGVLFNSYLFGSRDDLIRGNAVQSADGGWVSLIVVGGVLDH